MILRVRSRAAFQELAHATRRTRRPALWCSWCPEPGSTNATTSRQTAVAFALGRSLGPAVTRNRLRRRLRAICRELDRAGAMPSGLLLIGARPAAIELTFDQLRTEATALLTQLTTDRNSPPSSA